MERYTQFLLKHKKLIIGVFVLAAVLCAVLSGLVGVNYNFADYLPDDAASTRALEVMDEEYSQSVPNMRVLVYEVSIPQALAYKEKIADVDGVEEVNRLDDAVDIYEPLELAEQKTVEDWYKDGNALFSVTVDEKKQDSVIPAVREIIGEENCMSGTAVTSVLAPVNTSVEVQQIMFLAVPIIFLILILTTNSWFEPVLFMITIGVAILINRGTNLMFGTVSFVTNAAGSVLQLAVSMDYSIFLLHRFSENREEGLPVEKAMIEAVKQSVGSILSSGLTTVTGFLALVLMRFKIGPDMGWVMSKAIVLSLVSVLCFLPALAISTYRLIDKTQHRTFVPKFDKFAGLVMKLRIPALALVILILPVSFLGQMKNDFFYGGSQVYSTQATQMGRDMEAIDKMFGSSNPVVLMVPKGDMEKEIAMNEELKKLDCVTSVVSYVNSVGNAIPSSFLPSETVSRLYSAHYSRFVITMEAEEKDPDWYEKVNDIRNIGEKYYGDKIQYAGDLVSTEDLKTTITQDNTKVNFLAIAFVFCILLVNFKSLSLPVILTLVIESSIWINLGIPYFRGQTLFYIGYLIISTVQLGATIDYAILFSDRYMDFRKTFPKKESAFMTLRTCTISILTSAAVLTLAGVILGKVSTNGVLSQLGILIGRGAALSFVLVIFVLPTLLILFDGVIRRTTLHCDFFRKEKEMAETGKAADKEE
uniref:efflux RND transporter permease subunit n=1 Tax=Eisenbergiella tayi TaxID=1432052 RepID=UPI003FF129B4